MALPARAARFVPGAALVLVSLGPAPAEEKAAPEARAVSPSGAETALRDAVAAFIEANRGRIAGPGSLEGLGQALRALVGDLESKAAALETVAARRIGLAKTVHEALVAGLAGAGAPRADAQAAVDNAFRENMKARRERAEREVMCWCPTENWTRTLAGCAEGCAEEQKGLIREWLAAGFTDAEIVERMVAHPKGGMKVRAVPEGTGTNRLGYLAPFAFLAAAALVLVLVLRRVIRRPSRTHAPTGQNGESPPPDEEDDEIGRQIERELEEMER